MIPGLKPIDKEKVRVNKKIFQPRIKRIGLSLYKKIGVVKTCWILNINRARLWRWRHQNYEH